MIDEKKLIDELNEWSNLDKEMNELVLLCIDTFKRMINKQPKVGEWIPCSERLPEEAGVYRVTCLYADKVYRVKDDLFYSDRTWGYDNPNRNRKVIAWKLLEKPYRVPLEKDSKRLEKDSKKTRKEVHNA